MGAAATVALQKPASLDAALGVLEWIQYQLDTAEAVDDVLASDKRVRIDGRVPLHYLVSDRTGRAATIEFLHGRLVAHVGDALPVPVLTNSTCLPVSANRTAVAQASEVLPTPPLPVKNRYLVARRIQLLAVPITLPREMIPLLRKRSAAILPVRCAATAAAALWLNH